MTSFDITPTFLDLVAGLDKYIYGLINYSFIYKYLTFKNVL